MVPVRKVDSTVASMNLCTVKALLPQTPKATHAQQSTSYRKQQQQAKLPFTKDSHNSLTKKRKACRDESWMAKGKGLNRRTNNQRG